MRDQCFRQSSTFGCARSNSIVAVCLRSVKFLRVRVQCCIVLVSIEFLRKYIIVHSAVLAQIPSHHARLSALGQILLCLRSVIRRFVKYRILQLNDEKKSDVFIRSQKLAKKRTKRLNLCHNVPPQLA